MADERPTRDKVARVIEAPEDPVLQAAIEGLLLQRGPLTVAELVAALGESGLSVGRDESVVLDALYESYGTPFVSLGTRWVHLPALLAGRVFTHRLTGAEIDHDLLDLSPDLVAIAALEDAGPVQLSNGSEVVVAYGFGLDEFDLEPERAEAVADSGSIVVPPGTLADLSVHPGDLLSLTVTDSAIELARVDGEVMPHADVTQAG